MKHLSLSEIMIETIKKYKVFLLCSSVTLHLTLLLLGHGGKRFIKGQQNTLANKMLLLKKVVP